MKTFRLLLLLMGLLFGGTMGAQTLHWNSGIRPVENGNMTMVAVIVIDNVQQDNPQFELAAFYGDELSSLGCFPEEGIGCYILTISGNNGDEITFRVWDHVSDQLLNVNCETTYTYVQDEFLGMPDFYQIHFTTPAPQPTTYTLDIEGFGSTSNPGGYYLIASPVTEEITPSEANGFVSGSFDLYYFDQAVEQEWINYDPNQFTIQSTKGYLYASQEGTTLQFTGTPYSGNGNIPLVYSEANPSTNMRGWNLIGNPYPQAATIDMACYTMGEGDNGSELQSHDAGTSIPAMNGVFVKASAEGQSANFSTSGNANHDGHVIVNVLKDRGTAIDRAIVRLGEGSTLPKFMLNPNNTKIYIEQDGDDYAVVSSTANELPISFKASSNGTYTLNVAVENTEMQYLHLIDNIAGTDVNLLDNPSYTFEANTGDHANRFTLVMSSTVGVEEHFAFYNGHNWTVSNKGEATLQVIDMTGRVVSTKTIDGTSQLDVNAAPGVYMFRLVNGNDVKVQKIVVR